MVEYLILKNVNDVSEPFEGTMMLNGERSTHWFRADNLENLTTKMKDFWSQAYEKFKRQNAGVVNDNLVFSTLTKPILNPKGLVKGESLKGKSFVYHSHSDTLKRVDKAEIEAYLSKGWIKAGPRNVSKKRG